MWVLRVGIWPIVVQDLAPVKGVFVSIGRRLKEERERVGLSQTALAAAGEQSKRTQIYYEQDKVEPGAKYLSALARLGVDIQYVLTGVRSPTAKRAYVLATTAGEYQGWLIQTLHEQFRGKELEELTDRQLDQLCAAVAGLRRAKPVK